MEYIEGEFKEPHELGLEIQEMRSDFQKGYTNMICYMYNNLFLW